MVRMDFITFSRQMHGQQSDINLGLVNSQPLTREIRKREPWRIVNMWLLVGLRRFQTVVAEVASEEDEDMRLARALSMETTKDRIVEPSKDSDALTNIKKEIPKSEKHI